MDLVELLMSEHASLRIYFRHLKGMRFDSFFELDGFVNDCHVRMEGEALFPALNVSTKRLQTEHEALKMLSNGIRVSVAEDKSELDKNKVALYADTSESHNTSEEKTVFKEWRQVSKDKREEASTRGLEIIGSFGLERYLRITDFSSEFLSLLK